jgi:hypothetical protein
MKDVMNQYPSMARLRDDFKSLKVKRKSTIPKTEPTEKEMQSLLPDQEAVRHYLEYFFNTFGTTYHVIHGPSFWQEYEAYWKDPSNSRSGFVATMLLMMAIVRCAAAQETFHYRSDSSLQREEAIKWTKAAEIWLDKQSKKHQNITVFQCRCLWLIAQRINSMKAKEWWTNVGTVLRFAMSAGLHREPSLLHGKTSIFDQEMRRRIWAVITELELEASLERGMSSALSGFSFDCTPPSNLKDEDLKEDSEEALEGEQCGTLTPSAFLHASQRSLSLRISLTSQVNDLGAQLQFDDVLRFDESIRQELEGLPEWTDSEEVIGRSVGARALPAKVLFDITLRQYLLLIHGPLARRSDDNPRNAFSRSACFDAAARIITQYAQLEESGDHVLGLLRDDVFSASFITCHLAHLGQIRSKSFFSMRANEIPQRDLQKFATRIYDCAFREETLCN